MIQWKFIISYKGPQRLFLLEFTKSPEEYNGLALLGYLNSRSSALQNGIAENYIFTYYSYDPIRMSQ